MNQQRRLSPDQASTLPQKPAPGAQPGDPARQLLPHNQVAALTEVAKAEALSWTPNTRSSCTAGWKNFAFWTFQNNCAGLPATPVTVSRYLEHLVGERKSLATARSRLAAIAAAHCISQQADPSKSPVVKAPLKRLAMEYGKSRKQASGLTSEALAAVKATARIQRDHQDKRRRKETGRQAASRALVDLALLQVMRDGLLRRSAAAALTWGNAEIHGDGSGRLHVAGSKTAQTAKGAVLYLGPQAVDAQLAIRPGEAVIDPNASVFNLSARQVGRGIKAAAKVAGLGERYSAHSPRVGMAQDLSADGAELPG